jgi:hypothetical protein
MNPQAEAPAAAGRGLSRPLSLSVLLFEGGAFAATILLIWIDELLDLPRFLLGAEATPANFREALLESLLVLLLGTAVMILTHRLFTRVRILEGILPICASCKRIRTAGDTWKPIEDFLRASSEAEFSHSICPDCARTLYPELYQKRE